MKLVSPSLVGSARRRGAASHGRKTLDVTRDVATLQDQHFLRAFTHADDSETGHPCEPRYLLTGKPEKEDPFPEGSSAREP